MAEENDEPANTERTTSAAFFSVSFQSKKGGMCIGCVKCWQREKRKPEREQCVYILPNI